MKAFVERLCEHAGIVRVGPQAEKYGDPFDYAVAFKVDGNTASIKALASDGRMTIAHARACFATLDRLGLSPAWDRVK